MSAIAEPPLLFGVSKAEIFARDGYIILPGLIEPHLTAFLWSYVHTRSANLKMRDGDDQVAHTPCAYGDMAMDGLLEYLRPRVEAAAGYRLYPTYSYFRIYKQGDVLKRHSDRPACEISLSLNIGQEPSLPWPLFIEGHSGPFGANLFPGDALMYHGCDYPHWRDAYAGDSLAQVFLHYVDADGPRAVEKFDRRASLMLPARNSKEAEKQPDPAELKALRRKVADLKGLVAELSLENRQLKKDLESE